MPNQNFDNLNTDVTPIDFDFDELENIDKLFKKPNDTKTFTADTTDKITLPSQLLNQNPMVANDSVSPIQKDLDNYSNIDNSQKNLVYQIPNHISVAPLQMPAKQANNETSNTVTNAKTADTLNSEISPASKQTTTATIAPIAETIAQTKAINTPLTFDGTKPAISQQTTISQQNQQGMDEATKQLADMDTDAIFATSANSAKNQLYQQKRRNINPKAKAHYIDTKPTFGRRVLNSLSVGFIFAIIGLLVDWGVSITQAVANVSGETNWFFLPCFGIIGLILGFLFGAKALDVIFANFRSTDDDHTGDDGFAMGLFKAIGIGLGVAIIGWIIMMMLL